ncbi:hypothetical protein NLI96_g13009 [Meripilus lineatus]|uniref:F-box domain-containing protein n=1 Tax=Meripilus lineatus TaxID=2056292 RepID=A0AAD5UNV2_9APHY|nr:hypothetical protein NLI96_g13009 [Physisporinus lineatus]
MHGLEPSISYVPTVAFNILAVIEELPLPSDPMMFYPFRPRQPGRRQQQSHEIAPTPIPTLPLEIYEGIIELIDVQFPRRSDLLFYHLRLKTLHSCVLVCRDWVTKSRIQLYRKVILDHKQQADDFIETVSTNPKLGEYVQILEINPGARDRSDNDTRDWILRAHDILPPLLPRLFHLGYSRLHILRSPFIHISSKFKQVPSLSISDMGHQPFQEVVHLFSGFTNLQKLEIWDCYWDPSQSFGGQGLREQKRKPPTQMSLSLYSTKRYKGSLPSANGMSGWILDKLPPNSLNEFRYNDNFQQQPDSETDPTTPSLISLHRLMLHNAKTLAKLELPFDFRDLEGPFGDLTSCA